MDSFAEVGALTAFVGRVAGTDAERRAANHLRYRLRELGREAELEPLQIRPRYGLVHAIHALTAIGGGVLAVESPAPGAALVLAALVSTVLDVSGSLGRPLRRLTSRRASQNVYSPESGDKPGLLLLVAHYDAERTAPAFSLARRILRDPWRAMAIAMTIVLGCCVARILGLESTVLTAVQFAPTVVLIALVPAFADIELSNVGDGAANNAAGVACALRLADELGGRLGHFDLGVLLTGAAGPLSLGMRGWLRAHLGELDRERIAVLSIDGVGSGAVRFARRHGPLVSRAAHPELVGLCKKVADDDGPLGTYEARPFVSRGPGDAATARSRGLPALTVGCWGDDVSPEGLDRACGFCRELIERLDADVGPRLRSRVEPLPTELRPG